MWHRSSGPHVIKTKAEPQICVFVSAKCLQICFRSLRQMFLPFLDAYVLLSSFTIGDAEVKMYELPCRC